MSTARVVGLAAAVAVVLGTATSALAGGWATAELSPTPAGIGPGEPWVAEMTVLQHGRTPLDGVQPAVVISRGETTRSFPARPTGRPGVYAARVVFPAGGAWRVAADDGFGGVHDLPAVRIGSGTVTGATRPATPGESGLPWWVLAAAGGLAVAGATALGLRRLTARRENTAASGA